MDKKLTKLTLDKNSIFDNVPIMIFFKDKENRFLRVNKAFCLFMKKSKEELEGKHLANFYTEEEANLLWEDDKEVMESRTSKKNTVVQVTINKKVKWLQMEKVPYVDTTNTIVGIMCFVTDTTEATYLAKVLKDSEVRFRRLFEAAQDGILILDSDTALITEVNQYLVDMLGYSYDELLTKKLWEIGRVEDIEKSKELFKITQDCGYSTCSNLPLMTIDNKIIDVEFVSNLYTEELKNVIQCNIRNITKRRNEEQYEENKRLFKDEKEKIEFIAEANHELRTPLAIIKGSVDIILRESKGKTARYADNALRDIDEEVNHLLNILSDLALLTANNSHVDIKYPHKKINIKVLVDRIIKRSTILAKEKNIIIKKDVLEGSILGDEKYLEKLLMNLINNAIFYGNEGGWVKVKVIFTKTTVKISISDNGIGISAKDIPEIFSRFYRVDKSKNPDGRHTGLGLAISRRAVEAHNGTITVTSKGLGTGSTFIVTITKG